MNKRIKTGCMTLLLILSMCTMLVTSAMAATTTRCYTISSGNTQVYSNTGLTKKYGTIFGSDEVTVLSIHSSYCKVRYPISRGTKTGYIRRSAILVATKGKAPKAKAKVTTYCRPRGYTYGYIAKGDQVVILGSQNGYTQVRYPVSGGYKIAWVTDSNCAAYIKGNSGSGNNSGIAGKAANYASNRVGQSYPSGRCEAFVEECYQNVGVKRVYVCCAYNSGNKYLRSTSRNNIPVGATVFFGNCGGGPCRNCGSRYYGHVGIYVGNGYFVHATGGKVQKTALSSWSNKYRGWGYYANFQ